jgi:hypothetical protein
VIIVEVPSIPRTYEETTVTSVQKARAAIMMNKVAITPPSSKKNPRLAPIAFPTMDLGEMNIKISVVLAEHPSISIHYIHYSHPTGSRTVLLSEHSVGYQC